MSKSLTTWSRRALIALGAAFVSGCTITNSGFLNEAGPVAAGERHLFLIVVGIMLFVIGPVLLLTPLLGSP